MIEKRLVPTKDLEWLIRKLVRLSILISDLLSFLKSLHILYYTTINGIAYLKFKCAKDLLL